MVKKTKLKLNLTLYYIINNNLLISILFLRILCVYYNENAKEKILQIGRSNK